MSKTKSLNQHTKMKFVRKVFFKHRKKVYKICELFLLGVVIFNRLIVNSGGMMVIGYKNSNWLVV